MTAMKIEHIRIRNIASLAGQQPAISFVEDDGDGNGGGDGDCNGTDSSGCSLTSGLLAITGATGSGKSWSILDAVCLALYGITPRMQAAGAGGAGGQSDKEGSQPAHVISRGARDGFAEVDFRDHLQVPYRRGGLWRSVHKGDRNRPRCRYYNGTRVTWWPRAVARWYNRLFQLLG